MKDFLVIVLLAGLVACPLAWWLISKWLSGYAYKTGITPLPFIAAIVVLTLVTALIISVQTIKAALANPVKSLRSE
jgi:putative ABC transport system permease protein